MSTRTILAVSTLFSVAVLAVWIITGAHAYTKFQVVETVSRPVDEDDPLAGTGFYEDEDAVASTVRREAFHFGMLPTPEGVFDRHVIAGIPMLGLTWGIAGAILWRRRRNRANAPAFATRFDVHSTR